MTKGIRLNNEIISQIYFIRGRKVMLDSDLARIYGVTTSRMNEQVRRNNARFPSDFMFRLSREEFWNLMSQFAISSSGTVDPRISGFKGVGSEERRTTRTGWI